MSLGDALAAVRRVAHRLGIELRRFEPMRDHAEARIVAICSARDVDLLVDVGASYGTWAEAIRDAGYDGDVLSIEPHPEVYTDLAHRSRDDKRWETREVAAGSEAGTFDLHMAGGTVWSSLLPAADTAFAPTVSVGVSAVQVERLDTLLADDAHERLFLKLDAQGYKLEALRGAAGIVARTVAGKAEVLLEPLYSGQPTFTDFLSQLEEWDFEVVGFEHGFIKPSGEERFVDVLFARREPTQRARVRNTRTSRS